MAWTASTFGLIVFASGAVALLTGLATLRQRPAPLSTSVTVMLVAVAAWAVPHAIGLGYGSVERVVFWHRVRYVGTGVAPVAFLVVVLRYAGYERWLSRRTYALLAVVPATTVAFVWTNSFHHLFWRSVAVADVGGASVLVAEFGPWYWVNLGYLYAVTAVSLWLLAAAFLTGGRIYRRQSGLMFLGGLLPLATNVAVRFGTDGGPAVDFTTSALALSGLLFALALFHFDLLDLRPVARDQLVAELEDGVVVLGPNDRVRDYNPAAARIFDDIGIDRQAAEVFRSTAVPEAGEIVTEIDGRERVFRSRPSPLTDARGQETGTLVHLDDVTGLIEREQRIGVFNRVLRHNIRNELTVALGHLELLDERVDERHRNHLQRVHASAERVVALAEKARTLEATLSVDEPAATVEVTELVERVVEEVSAAAPEARIEYRGPTEPTRARAVDRELLEAAFTELVENAVEHSDRAAPTVIVDVESDREAVRFVVADDGPGIPAPEMEVLTKRTETPLDHGSGLGLWLVKWTATLSTGELSFGENDPRGTVVTLSLPVA